MFKLPEKILLKKEGDEVLSALKALQSEKLDSVKSEQRTRPGPLQLAFCVAFLTGLILFVVATRLDGVIRLSLMITGGVLAVVGFGMLAFFLLTTKNACSVITFFIKDGDKYITAAYFSKTKFIFFDGEYGYLYENGKFGLKPDENGTSTLKRIDKDEYAVNYDAFVSGFLYAYSGADGLKYTETQVKAKKGAVEMRYDVVESDGKRGVQFMFLKTGVEYAFYDIYAADRSGAADLFYKPLQHVVPVTINDSKMTVPLPESFIADAEKQGFKIGDAEKIKVYSDDDFRIFVSNLK